MKATRLTKYLSGPLLIMLAVLCASCLYSRLLSFKNQLGSFDAHVRFTNSGSTLEFLKPVVDPGDLVELTDLPPTRIELGAEGKQVHTYNYRSLSATESDETPRNLRFTLHFNLDGLAAFDYPPVVAQVLGTNFIAVAAKAIGNAKLIHREYKLDWVSQSTNSATMPIPSLPDIERVLGAAQSSSNTPSYYFANYSLALEKDDGTMRTNGMIKAAFQFDPSNSLLQRGLIRIGKLQLAIDLSSVTNQAS